jgi:histidine triad (HIT) family protein
MKDCVFCKIVRGKIPCYKTYEDDDFLAFLDIQPLTRGNCLVIPKRHYHWTYNVPNFGEYFEVAKRVGIAAQEAFNSGWICFLTLGLEVPHAHIRVIPRYKDDLHEEVISLARIERFTDKEMKKIAEEVKKHLKT